MTDDATTNSSDWLGRFFASYYERRPVNATFIGVHDHDSRLPDLSSEGVQSTVDEMRSLLASVPKAGLEPASADPIDCRVAEGFLRIQIWEYESRHLLRNPSVHAGEAVFGMMSLLLSDFAPLERRLESLSARMEALPDFFAQARLHCHAAPPGWTRRAIRECEGGLAFLDYIVSQRSDELSNAAPSSLPGAAKLAAEAFGEFRHFLEADVGERDDAGVACGAEAFELYLSEGHFLDRDASEIVAYAREELDRATTWLADSASEYGLEHPDDAVERLADLGPDVEGYYRRYEDVWHNVRELSEERDLVTWPDFPIRYAPRPEWARAAAPSLYFLFYRSPPAFGGPAIHDYLVTPIDESIPGAERETLLRSHNDSVIKLNHVIHHGGIGHHIQNWHARRAPSRIGRIAAVDCSARIAMFCGATMAEGWACYATDLIAEAGGLTPLEQYAEYRGRVRMCARAIVDVELHHGRMTLEQAAAFYVATAGMNSAAAEAEAVKNSMFPAAALIYLIGTDLIHDLRADLMQTLGDRFTLRRFHDAFLSYGSLPVRLVSDEMRRRAASGLPLGAHEVLGPAEQGIQ
jgi:hypothetical protein